MKRYKVKHTSILHNGRLYKEGSTIELEDSKAKRLEDFLENALFCIFQQWNIYY